ncbi:MAG: phosphatase PAP2 family protein [Acidobacteriota bacterium]|nr:phosphatase PAP2 family protein [Acidobacteriota bacterium]MDE3190410.1 phosphatase PAP2 family protein [Acidobacteriota bacterium]
MDWRLYKAIYGLSLHHHWLGSLFHAIEQASIPFMIVITLGLWLAAKPGTSRKWKLASTGALLASGLALATNRIIAAIWFRRRPFIAHHIAHPWINSHDASFPSDHASASFAIAFAVVMVDPLVGAVFLLLALVIAVGRLLIGAHYPGDVAAGFLIGAASATVVMRLAQPLVRFIVEHVEKVTDPLLRPFWRSRRA